MPGNARRGLFASENPETGPRGLLPKIALGAVLFAGLIVAVFLLTR
jgi:hypothetical protein